MSEKDGHHHHCHGRHHKFLRWFLAFLLILVVAVLLTVLIIWLVLRPTKPKFSLGVATVSTFNLSTDPSLLTTNFQVTFSSRNPNDRIGIYYDRMDVYASYMSQQITTPVRLYPLYQGHKELIVWSPYLYGVCFPISPYLSQALLRDENEGVIKLRLIIDGRVRWKVGSWTSGRYHLYVNCPAYLTFYTGNGDTEPSSQPAIRFQQTSPYCHVDV